MMEDEAELESNYIHNIAEMKIYCSWRRLLTKTQTNP